MHEDIGNKTIPPSKKLILKVGGGSKEMCTDYTDHFRSDFSYGAGYWFASTSVICHLKFDRVSDLKMLDVAIKLTKVEEKSCLAFTTLNEAIRVL